MSGKKSRVPAPPPGTDGPALVAAVAAWLVAVTAFLVVPFHELYRVAFSTSLLIALNGQPSEAQLAEARRAPVLAILVALAGLAVVAWLRWFRVRRGERARDTMVLLGLGVLALVVAVVGAVLFRDAF